MNRSSRNRGLRSKKIMIIGAGNVGRAAAFSILSREICNEIILSDINEEVCMAHVKDLNDASFCFGYGAPVVSMRPVTECSDIDIAVLTVAAPRSKDSTNRADELIGSAKIIKSIVPAMKKANFKGIFIVATNPCDAITYLVWKLSGLPKERVFGTGVWLDTARLHCLLAEEGMASEGLMLGEHGMAQFPYTMSEVAGNVALINRVRRRAYEIKPFKGCTDYGIGAVICNLCERIIDNVDLVVPISVICESDEIAIGLPACVGSNGAFPIMPKFNDEEQQAFAKAKKIIRGYIGTPDVEVSSDGK